MGKLLRLTSRLTTRSRPPSSGPAGYSRVVHLNEPDKNRVYKYPWNRTSTTKYSIITFLPKGLYEQFRRLANLYFLFQAALSLTPLSPFSPVTVIFPLVFVIGVSLLKEAIEDYVRYQADVEVNGRLVEKHVGEGRTEKVPWRKLQVGDIVKVERDAYFPADLLFLSSSNADATGYVETMNLDGETNLKTRRAVDRTQGLSTGEAFASFKYADIECEEPNASLYTFVGNLTLQSEVIPLSPNQILLRDSTLRNTEWIWGAVIFSGHDTKVFMNATDPPSKRSSLERQMDRIVLALFLALVVLAVITGLVFGLLLDNNMPDMWYLKPDDTTVYYDPSRAFTASVLQFVTVLVLYGYLIPISLYVTIELVKVLQARLISWDLDMYDEATGKCATCRTSNLNEELGQIDTILSDKTGTLTANQMEFFKCSIAGVTYGMGTTEVERAAIARMRAGDQRLPSFHHTSADLDNSMETVTTADVASEDFDTADSADADVADSGHFNSDSAVLNVDSAKPNADSGAYNDDDSEADLTSPKKKRSKFFNLSDARLLDGNWVKEKDPAAIRKFFQVLALCQTVIPEGEPSKESIKYQAESPDEAALVTAAKEFGFFFYKRTSTSAFIREPSDSNTLETDNEYQVLQVLEFNSTRKRMSVIVRDAKGSVTLYSKGADNVIYERLSPQGKTHWGATAQHLTRYSEAGLRTLVLAYKELGEEEYQNWAKIYNEARQIVGPNRAAKLEEAGELIEKDLILAGATAVEDKLQEGVPQAIDRLAKAGLKIWVLTGDKLETAINIGFACSLLRQGMHQIIVHLDNPDIKAAEESGDKDRIFQESMASVSKQLKEGQESMEKVKAVDPEAVFAFVIDGKSLTFALDESLLPKFLSLAEACASLICCRVSPKQKALVTLLVKERLNKICLGIGDGANDVGMINAAHIGVGISGVEGTQAVMASDFAISQFRFLERLLLVHGRWCYRRVANMVTYFFYKNLTFGLTLFLFNRMAFFSGQGIYDDWFLSFYNLIFTSIPVVVVGVLDQDVTAESSLNFPALYLQSQSNSYFSWMKIGAWLMNGIYSSLINFYLVLLATRNEVLLSNGKVAGLYDIGTFMYTTILWTVTCQISIAITYWTWLHHVAIWGSIALWYLFVFVYSYLPSNYTSVYDVFLRVLWPSLVFWLLPLVIIPIALAPDFLWRAMIRTYKPSDYHIIQEAEKQGLLQGDPISWQKQMEKANKKTQIGFSLAIEAIVKGAMDSSHKVEGFAKKGFRFKGLKSRLKKVGKRKGTKSKSSELSPAVV